MRNPTLTLPELLFIVGTRAALAAGVALVFSRKLSRSQRLSIGTALIAFGAVTTIPAAMALFGDRPAEPSMPAVD